MYMVSDSLDATGGTRMTVPRDPSLGDGWSKDLEAQYLAELTLRRINKEFDEYERRVDARLRSNARQTARLREDTSAGAGADTIAELEGSFSRIASMRRELDEWDREEGLT